MTAADIFLNPLRLKSLAEFTNLYSLEGTCKEIQRAVNEVIDYVTTCSATRDFILYEDFGKRICKRVGSPWTRLYLNIELGSLVFHDSEHPFVGLEIAELLKLVRLYSVRKLRLSAGEVLGRHEWLNQFWTEAIVVDILRQNGESIQKLKLTAMPWFNH